MCPLCRRSIADLYGNVCPSCYKKFVAEREAATKKPGILPETLANTRGESGYDIWLAGKSEQLAALQKGASDELAEKIGFEKMEREIKRKQEARALQEAQDAQKRAMQSRLFRHI